MKWLLRKIIPKIFSDVFKNTETNENRNPSTSISIPITPLRIDQSTQASFPVLLRSQQKALKRYATLADIKHIPPKFPPISSPWSTHNSAMHGQLNSAFNSSVNNLNSSTVLRPKSMNLNVDSGRTSRVSGNYDHRHKQSNLNLTQGFEHSNQNMNSLSRSRLSTMNSYNTLSPRQYLGESPASHAGSDNSYNDKNSTGGSVVYSGHFKAVHQSQFKIGVDQQDSLSISKTMCSCHDNPTKELRHTNTPEGLSWRRLHMSRAKLKATATTSELLSGFAMVAMVELQINEPTTVPEWLFVLFAVCTTILVAVHIFALMISTYILPNIDAISKLDVCELVSESPHERMRGFIELAWAFSTVLGLFLFLVEIAILCWVKFWDYSFTAAIAATIIVIPVLIMFVAFAVHFYHSLVVHKCATSDSDIQQLEDMKKELDLATSPV